MTLFLALTIFAVWSPPLPQPPTRYHDCAAVVRRMVPAACLDGSAGPCFEIGPMVSVPCVTLGQSMWTDPPAPGEVVMGCARACNDAGCSDCTGGYER